MGQNTNNWNKENTGCNSSKGACSNHGQQKQGFHPSDSKGACSNHSHDSKKQGFHSTDSKGRNKDQKDQRHK